MPRPYRALNSHRPTVIFLYLSVSCGAESWISYSYAFTRVIGIPTVQVVGHRPYGRRKDEVKITPEMS